MFISWLPAIMNDPNSKIYPGALRILADLFWPQLQQVHGPIHAFLFQSMPSRLTPPPGPVTTGPAYGHPLFSTANLAAENSRLIRNSQVSNESFIQQLIQNH